MSDSVQTYLFLPSYLLDYVVNDVSPRFDFDCFLSKASNPQILETILAVFPHFTFEEAAKEDRELLQKTFLQMVAKRLSIVLVPSSSSHPPSYFRANLEYPIFGPHDCQTTVAPGLEIDASRKSEFSLTFAYLKNGKYRLAGQHLLEFVKDYKHLNQDEIHEIACAEDDASEALDECAGYLKKAYQSVEGQILLLSEPNISPSDRKDIQSRLESANTVLQSCEETFRGAIRDAAYLSALQSYHCDRLPANERSESHQSSCPSCARQQMKSRQ